MEPSLLAATGLALLVVTVAISSFAIHHRGQRRAAAIMVIAKGIST